MNSHWKQHNQHVSESTFYFLRMWRRETWATPLIFLCIFCVVCYSSVHLYFPTNVIVMKHSVAKWKNSRGCIFWDVVLLKAKANKQKHKFCSCIMYKQLKSLSDNCLENDKSTMLLTVWNKAHSQVSGDQGNSILDCWTLH